MNNSESEQSSLRTVSSGQLEFAGTRVFLQDVAGGFYALREQMTREIGAEYTADILYRSGFSAAERLMNYVDAVFQDQPKSGTSSLDLALSLLTQSGYGLAQRESSRRRAGEIGIRVEDSLEGETMRDRAGRGGHRCDYLRGLLRGVVQRLPEGEGVPKGPVECVEISCLANDDPECVFVVGASEHLTEHGYRISDIGYSSVRETLLRLNRQLEDVLEAAKRDSLTGLYNRAHFESALRQRIEYANRSTDTLTVAMIDVDGFKQVNDSHGHGMGDLALRRVAQVLASHARETDVVARYGGDEFAWLMPGTSMEAALAVADRIRRLVQESQQEIDLPVTLSVGIAACPDDATSMADLVELADAAMYSAKGSGGNLVKRYRAGEDQRAPQQKRFRKPRIRTVSNLPPPRPASEEVLRLDLND